MTALPAGTRVAEDGHPLTTGTVVSPSPALDGWTFVRWDVTGAVRSMPPGSIVPAGVAECARHSGPAAATVREVADARAAVRAQGSRVRPPCCDAVREADND